MWISFPVVLWGLGFFVLFLFFSQIIMIKLIRFLCYILEKKDDFDWGKYLMEGEEIGLGPNADSPVSGCVFAIANVNTWQQ